MFDLQNRGNVIAGGDTDDPGGAFAQTRARVIERLRARRSEIEEAIFVRVRDGVFDPAGNGDAEYAEGLRAAIAAVVDYGLTGIEQGETSSAAVPSVTLAQARRAARAGVGDRGGSRARPGQAAQEQSAWIMQALVEVLAERGFAGATIGLVIRRARVSTRTFYQRFDGLKECLIAIMDTVLEEAAALVSLELQGAGCWQDGVRSALAAMLSYFDREPGLARVCIVETLAGGPVVLAHRERLLQAFRMPILQRIEREVPNVSPLAAEGAMSSVLGIMHAHIVTARPGPFIELLGPLIGLIMAAHLAARGVERAIEQGDELARAILAGDSRWSPPAQSSEQDTGYGGEQVAALPAILDNPSARRPRECLLFLAEHPDSSNREVAVGIDITHRSHISRLLACLLHENLATKRSDGKGKRNAWRLTARGEEIARTLR
ncbi:MAG TPA: TetR/AcrR family transcriptional regulator [Solirubrobacteraceae bacterium]|nr:TetR/AcrR family transcriptional regulator [Solirubrobacteraceae bacterium]